jgi:hypothetical protein
MSTINEDARRVLEEYGARLPEGARALIQELSGAAVRMRGLIDALLAHSH